MKELGVRSQEKTALLWLLAAGLSALPKARGLKRAVRIRAASF
jgi:hypothetical protein